MNFKKYMLFTSCLISLNAANAGGFEEMIKDIEAAVHSIKIKIANETYDFPLPENQSSIQANFTKELDHSPKSTMLYVSNAEDNPLFQLRMSYWETPQDTTLGGNTHAPLTILWSIDKTTEDIVKSPMKTKGYATEKLQEADYLRSLHEIIKTLKKTPGPILFSSEIPEVMHVYMQAQDMPMIKPGIGWQVAPPQGEPFSTTPEQMAHVRQNTEQTATNTDILARVKDLLGRGDSIGITYTIEETSATSDAISENFTKALGHPPKDVNINSTSMNNLLYTAKFSYWEQPQEMTAPLHDPVAILRSIVVPPKENMTDSMKKREMAEKEMRNAKYLISLESLRKSMYQFEENLYYSHECPQDVHEYLSLVGMNMLKPITVNTLVLPDDLSSTALDIRYLAQVRQIEPESSSSSSTTTTETPAGSEDSKQEYGEILAKEGYALLEPTPTPEPTPVATEGYTGLPG